MQALYKIQNLRDEMTKSLQNIQTRMVEFEEKELDKSLQSFEEAKSATKEMGQFDKSIKKGGDKKVSSSDLSKLEERLGETDKKNKLNTIAATLRMKEVDSKKFDTLNELLIDIVLKYADFFKKGSGYLSNVEEEMRTQKDRISKVIGLFFSSLLSSSPIITFILLPFHFPFVKRFCIFFVFPIEPERRRSQKQTTNQSFAVIRKLCFVFLSPFVYIFVSSVQRQQKRKARLSTTKRQTSLVCSYGRSSLLFQELESKSSYW
jgi:preprotein translocase subunit YajC